MIFIFGSSVLFIVLSLMLLLKWPRFLMHPDSILGGLLQSVRYPVLGFTFLLLIAVSSQTFERIEPGEVGVVVNLIGSDKGVEEKELMVGYHIVFPWENLYRFPIYEQNHQWVGADGFHFQTSEGLSVHADIGITFNLMPNRIHELFYKYRRGMEEITNLFIRNNVRDAINKISSRLKVEDLLGPMKEEFFRLVINHIQEELEPLGFHVSHIYVIGEFHVPESVKMALNKKIEAIQRAQQRENELRETEAEAKKEIAKSSGYSQSQLIRAKAEAEANHILSKSLTAELVKWEAMKKWDGKLSIVSGSGGNIIDISSVVGKKEDKGE